MTKTKTMTKTMTIRLWIREYGYTLNFTYGMCKKH